MKRMLINTAHPEEIRVAFIEEQRNGQKLYDLDIESRDKRQKLENIYKARVDEVLSNLSAAFVNYGQNKSGFLSLKHTKASPEGTENTGICGDTKILPEKGQEILVQVIKDERGNKGANLTTDISLKSQHLTLYPYNSFPNRRLFKYLPDFKRQILEETKKELSIPEGMGVAIKPGSIQTAPKKLQKEVDWLLQVWQEIIQANESKDYPAPQLLYQREPSPARVLRDYLAAPVDEIVVDTPETFADFSELIDWCLPEYQGKLKMHEGPRSLFNEYGIDRQAEQGLDRTIRLNSGGTIVIDTTEALTAIDVNSSQDKGETLTINMEAIDEISRQLRIRDIGGLVVVDLIGTSNKENPNDVEKLYRRMKENIFYDRAVTRIEKISRFGLLEIERQRLRTSLANTITNRCPHCQGKGSVVSIEHAALQVIYKIEDNIKKSIKKINASISPEVTSYIFNNKRTKISSIEKENDLAINIVSNPKLENNNFELYFLDYNDRFLSKFSNISLNKYSLKKENKNENPSVKLHKKPKVGFISKLFSKLFKSKNKTLVKKDKKRISKNSSKNINKKYNYKNKSFKSTGRTDKTNNPSNPTSKASTNRSPTNSLSKTNHTNQRAAKSVRPTNSPAKTNHTNQRAAKSVRPTNSPAKTNHQKQSSKPQTTASNTVDNKSKALNDPRAKNQGGALAEAAAFNDPRA